MLLYRPRNQRALILILTRKHLEKWMRDSFFLYATENYRNLSISLWKCKVSSSDCTPTYPMPAQIFWRNTASWSGSILSILSQTTIFINSRPLTRSGTEFYLTDLNLVTRAFTWSTARIFFTTASWRPARTLESTQVVCIVVNYNHTYWPCRWRS